MIYDIAGLRIDIQNRCTYSERFCREYLSADQTSPIDLVARVTKEEFYAEKAVSSSYSDGYVENICLYRIICRQLPLFNRILLHAAILQYDGAGYAFLGRSGTGKSTHTGLWMKHINSCSIVNGDKPILQYTPQNFIAYGTPWMGKENYGEKTSVPLKGLCFLEQAKENEIVRLSPSEASNRIFLQILLPEEEDNVVRTLELTDKLVSQTPCYLLKCDISEDAVRKSFEALTGKKYDER